VIRNDKCDLAFVKGEVVRVLQSSQHFVPDPKWHENELTADNWHWHRHLSHLRMNLSLPSGSLFLRGRSQRDGGFAGEHQKSERLLQIQADSGIGVAEVTDGDVLAEV
jgi:hypothetical protein